MLKIVLSFLSANILFCSEGMGDFDICPARVSFAIEDVCDSPAKKRQMVFKNIRIDASQVDEALRKVGSSQVQKSLHNVRIDASQVEKVLRGKLFYIKPVNGLQQSTKTAAEVLQDAVCAAKFQGKSRFFSLAFDKITDYVLMAAGVFLGPTTSRLWHFSDEYFVEEEMLEEKPEKVVVRINNVNIYGKTLECVTLGKNDYQGDVYDVQGLYLARKPYRDNKDIFDFRSATNSWYFDPLREGAEEKAFLQG